MGGEEDPYAVADPQILDIRADSIDDAGAILVRDNLSELDGLEPRQPMRAGCPNYKAEVRNSGSRDTRCRVTAGFGQFANLGQLKNRGFEASPLSESCQPTSDKVFLRLDSLLLAASLVPQNCMRALIDVKSDSDFFTIAVQEHLDLST
ncbi:hypothetical protein ACX3O0_08195 [Homoserinimonas sp. A447]